MNDILGQGCKFPFQFSKLTGATVISTATSRDQQHIHESLRQILGTPRGARFLLPAFGSRLHELLFEGNDAILRGLVRHEVTDVLTAGSHASSSTMSRLQQMSTWCWSPFSIG